MNFVSRAAIFLTLTLALLFGLYQEKIISAHESDEVGVAVIHVSEKGFEPSTLSIKIGTEIVFKNVGNGIHWPASDDHPSHTLYDGTSIEEHCGSTQTTFDSCKEIQAGETWSFTFEKAGTFDYHDHLSPHLTGTIVVKVEEKKENIFSRLMRFLTNLFKKSPAERVKSDENKTTNIDNKLHFELKERYKSITLGQDPRAAIEGLEQESLADTRVYALCHEVLHEIGKVAYGKYGSFGEATRFTSDFCNSGYLHGVFEAYFKSSADPAKGLAEQCGSYASERARAFDLWQCYHGAGHGFMYFTGGDLDRSLFLCETSFGKEMARHCQNGVFMEIFNLEILAKEKGVVNPENPFLVCAERKMAKGECYPYIAVYLHHTGQLPFSEIFGECREAELGYRGSCVYGIGVEAMKRSMGSPRAALDICLRTNSGADKKSCISGAINIYIMNRGGETEEVDRLCGELPETELGVCRAAISDTELFFKQLLHFEKN